MWLKILICFLAGMGAGLGTGFAGMSAAAVISPMLITFLGIDPYIAVGVALASDVLASATSAYTYKKNNNIDIKNGLVMMICVLIFTLVGSYIAKLSASIVSCSSRYSAIARSSSACSLRSFSQASEAASKMCLTSSSIIAAVSSE